MGEAIIRTDDSYRKVEIFISCRNLADKDLFSKLNSFVTFSIKNLFENKWV